MGMHVVTYLHHTNNKTNTTGEGAADGSAAAAAAAEMEADGGDWAELDAGERNSLLSQRLKVGSWRVCRWG